MDHVRYDVDENICTITMDRPEVRNAVDGPMAAELREAFQQFEEDESLAVAVLTGAGGTFCAGADLSAVDDPERRNELDPEGLGGGPMGPSRMELTKPVIAAVSGHAVAGGLELALLADLRVVEEDAVFGVFCRRWGVPLIDGGTVRLPRIIGQGRALDMILTGRPVGAHEALQMGLANRVVPVGDSLTVCPRPRRADRCVPGRVHEGRPRLGLPPVGPAPRCRAAFRRRQRRTGRDAGRCRRRGPVRRW